MPRRATAWRRCCRAVGVWGPFRGRLRDPEERHGFAAALPSVGGLGAISGPLAQSRGAPRLGRGASERWGFGGHLGAPMFLMTRVWEVEDWTDAVRVQTAAECEERQEP